MKAISMITLLTMSLFTGTGQERPAGQPSEVVNAGGISIPVYDFKGFEPFLTSGDDTTYIINFWATWCKPCLEELPSFLRLSGELAGEKVAFIFVSLDFRKNLESLLIPFVKEHGISENVVMLHDPAANSWIGKVDPSWSGAIPATLVYRKDRREFTEEMLLYDELKSIVHSFINL